MKLVITSAYILGAISPVSALTALTFKVDQIDLRADLNPATGKSYCPAYIVTKQQLNSTGDTAADADIAILTETSSTGRNNLETIDFYSGPASGQAQLKPDQYGKVSRWEFSDSGGGIHYACRYQGTNVTLDAPLAGNFAKCEAFPYKDKYGAELYKYICTPKR
jgi:hypothetical protein